MSGDVFDCHESGVCYWHLVGRVKGCCPTSYRAQEKSLQTKTDAAQNVNGSRLRTPLTAWPPKLQCIVESAEYLI